MSSLTFELRSAALVLLAGALGGACGGSSGVDYTEIASFCQALAQADCSQPVVQDCYGSSAATLPTDTQSCVARRASPEVCNPLNLDYHAAYAQPCVDAHTAAYGTAELDPAALQSMTQACLPVFNQGGEQGSHCSADTDCDAGGGLSCVLHQSTGSCEAPTTVMPGSSCADPSAVCTAGYFCEASGYCVAEPSQGQACSATLACSPGLRCDSSGDVCAGQLQDDSPCTEATDCVGGVCITTSTGGVCAANYTFAVGSATCTGFLPE